LEKEISILILDGDKFEISEDKKFITGKGKKYSKDDFQKEMKDKFLFLEAPPERIGTPAVYGFSTESKYEKWLKDNKLDETYGHEKRMLEKVKKKLSTLTTEEIEGIKQKQIKNVKATTEKYEKFLKKHNLKRDDIKKIEELMEEEYDPFVGGSHTVWLFDGFNYLGAGYGFAGDLWGGLYYHDLRAFNMNNKTSSVMFTTSGPCSCAILFDGYNFTGRRFRIWSNLPILIWWLFDNITSSLVVF